MVTLASPPAPPPHAQKKEAADALAKAEKARQELAARNAAEAAARARAREENKKKREAKRVRNRAPLRTHAACALSPARACSLQPWPSGRRRWTRS
jgi:hypothetical protein